MDDGRDTNPSLTPLAGAYLKLDAAKVHFHTKLLLRPVKAARANGLRRRLTLVLTAAVPSSIAWIASYSQSNWRTASFGRAAVARALHDFLATDAQKLATDDPLLQGGPASPALERYREERRRWPAWIA